MEVRKVWLKNRTGETFGAISTFLDLSGFGLKQSFSNLRIGNSVLITKKENDFVPKQLNACFYGTVESAYFQYEKFLRFLRLEPIYLFYEPPNRKGNPVFCEVKVGEVRKTEFRNGILECPTTLIPVSFWYEEAENIYSSNKAEMSGKKYPLRRSYFYGTSSTSNIEVYNAGMTEAPLEIWILGKCNNPQFQLFDSYGNKYGACKFNGEFDEVYVNSSDLKETIQLKREGAYVANPYNYQDLNIGAIENVATTFLKLKSGSNKISFSLENDFHGTVMIKWRNVYESI